MSTSSGDHQLVRRRHLARAELLKRRATAASAIAFAALFGLVAQHVVRGTSAKRARSAPSSLSAANAATTFFDQRDGDFSFDGAGSAFSQDLGPAPPPVAQTSVS